MFSYEFPIETSMDRGFPLPAMATMTPASGYSQVPQGPPAEACGGKEGRPEQVVLTPSDVMGFLWYPLVMTNIANWKITM